MTATAPCRFTDDTAHQCRRRDGRITDPANCWWEARAQLDDERRENEAEAARGVA